MSLQLLFGCVEHKTDAVAPAWRGACAPLRGAAPPGVSAGRSGEAVHFGSRQP